MKKFQVKIVDINEIVKSEYNPRIIYKQEFYALVNSIKEFGFVEPIVVNTREHSDFKSHQWTIVGGHQRYEAAKKLGYKEVPVVFINISPQKEKVLNLALNKISGEFDTPKLAEVLYGLIEKDNLPEEDILGFSHEEITTILDTVMDAGGDEDFELKDEIEKAKKTNVKFGDIYQIGLHRLMCGDSTKRKDVDKLINGKKIDMVLTDPPYGVGYKYNKYDDKKNYEKYKQFTIDWLKNAKALCKLLVIFSGHYNKRIWYEIDNSLQEMVWLKKNGQSPGFVSYLLKTEPILVFGKPKGRYAMDLFERLLVFNDDLKGEHTCPKPVDLMMDLLKPQVGTNGIVLDLFGGSGSTMVAAASCRRRCYMMEIDPVYVQVIIDRMKKLGANAKKIN